ncbi:MAG: 5-bromo-4-chloroindolyl phosphate hydrolysis family protein [Pseudomonadota bacterium]
MAQRYGGKFSKSNESMRDWSGAKPRRSRFAVRVVAAMAIPLFIAGVLELTSGDVISAIIEWGAALGLGFAAWLIDEGEKAQEAFEARQIAKPPSFPRKIFGSVVIGFSVFAIYFGNGDLGFINHILLAGLSTILALVSFGLDPMRSKGLEGEDSFERERVAIAIEKAETYVVEILEAGKRIGDRNLTDRVERMAKSVRTMFRTIEDDPRDLSSSRKYLSVYLKGARDATRKFAELYSRTKDKDARAEYEALLEDLETSFSQRREILLLENRTDLDVEIEVLRERLAASTLKP